MKAKFKSSNWCAVFTLITTFFSVPLVQAQDSCPQYIEHHEYVRKIKYCSAGQYFTAWEECEFKIGSICPCPSVHEEACLSEG